ncbi:hypothetical protein HanRHA438_Chr10g0456441 [Helianthus annuus]|nr:hypothetical protein HanRHA438_Chr10g0456441 [Helianthus annuus]
MDEVIYLYKIIHFFVLVILVHIIHRIIFRRKLNVDQDKVEEYAMIERIEENIRWLKERIADSGSGTWNKIK